MHEPESAGQVHGVTSAMYDLLGIANRSIVRVGKERRRAFWPGASRAAKLSNARLVRRAAWLAAR
jgi:hypothetical protein